MVELTMNTIIKITIGVVVIVMVIFAIVMGFQNYIIPYFEGFSPGDEEQPIDLTDPDYIELRDGGIVIATIQEIDNRDRIIFTYNLKNRDFYIDEKKIMLTEKGIFNWDWTANDAQVGSIGDRGKIALLEAFEIKTPIGSIHGATRLGKEIKIKKEDQNE